MALQVVSTEIKRALRARLLRSRGEDDRPILLEELGFVHGASRADLVAIYPHSLCAFEIKGAGDDLRRLPEQVRLYSAVFDRITIACTLKHLAGALEVVPSEWGVIVFTRGARGSTRSRTLRAATSNRSVDPVHLARLLWKQEALDLLPAETARGLASRRRDDVYRALADALSLSDLRDSVIAAIVRRVDLAPGEPPSSGGG